MVAPIKKSLLIHEIEYQDFTEGRYGNDYGEKQTVKHVRLDPKSKRIKTPNGEEFIAQTTLYWDATHSDYCRFHKNGKVIFNGMEMHVGEVAIFYDDRPDKVHHLEVFLR